MGKVHSFSFFFYIIYHNIIWFLSVLQCHTLSLTHSPLSYKAVKGLSSLSPSVLQSQFYITFFPACPPFFFCKQVRLTSVSPHHYSFVMEHPPFFSSCHSMSFFRVTLENIFNMCIYMCHGLGKNGPVVM